MDKVMGNTNYNVHRKSDESIKATKCTKCGKEIPPGQEVKKGFLMKKSYHRECAG
jgi:hypothetical protein